MVGISCGGSVNFHTTTICTSHLKFVQTTHQPACTFVLTHNHALPKPQARAIDDSVRLSRFPLSEPNETVKVHREWCFEIKSIDWLNNWKRPMKLRSWIVKRQCSNQCQRDYEDNAGLFLARKINWSSAEAIVRQLPVRRKLSLSITITRNWLGFCSESESCGVNLMQEWNTCLSAREPQSQPVCLAKCKSRISQSLSITLSNQFKVASSW